MTILPFFFVLLIGTCNSSLNSNFEIIRRLTDESQLGESEDQGDMPPNYISSLNPPGLKYQTREESKYLNLHKCRDSGEAYAASYLTTKQHLIEQFTDYNLTWYYISPQTK